MPCVSLLNSSQTTPMIWYIVFNGVYHKHEFRKIYILDTLIYTNIYVGMCVCMYKTTSNGTFKLIFHISKNE